MSAVSQVAAHSCGLPQPSGRLALLHPAKRVTPNRAGWSSQGRRCQIGERLSSMVGSPRCRTVEGPAASYRAAGSLLSIFDTGEGLWARMSTSRRSLERFAQGCVTSGERFNNASDARSCDSAGLPLCSRTPKSGEAAFVTITGRSRRRRGTAAGGLLDQGGGRGRRPRCH